MAKKRGLGVERYMIISELSLRSIVSKVLSEELTKSDKNKIEKIAKTQAKKYFDSEISKAIDKELGKSFLGARGKINKHANDTITARFKNSKNDKDFDEAVIKVAKRVLKALHDMHFKRNNLIDQMPVPKS